MARYSGGTVFPSGSGENGNTNRKKIGIALGVGIPVILMFFAAMWWWKRRKQNKSVIPVWLPGGKKRDRMHRTKKLSRAQIRQQREEEEAAAAAAAGQDVSPPPPAYTNDKAQVPPGESAPRGDDRNV